MAAVEAAVTAGASPVPVTVFTGYLGAGKTTIILGLIRSLPKDYNCVWLKNEFGDVEIDSEVAREGNIAVKEIINGCLCCVLVGQLSTALEQIVAEQNPSRIIIETSGSAYPAPIALEIRKLPFVKLDGIVTVIDALNFTGYEDKSFTAREQTKYTDLILINKHELVTDPGVLDKTLDDVYELNPDTPKVRTMGDRGSLSPDVVFGLDTQLFCQVGELEVSSQVQNIDHHKLEVDLLQATPGEDYTVERAVLEKALKNLPDEVYRGKGLLPVKDPSGETSTVLFNYVAGRVTQEVMTNYKGPPKLIFMGEDLEWLKDRILKSLGIPLDTARVHDRGEDRVGTALGFKLQGFGGFSRSCHIAKVD
mmetsp:Transcript_19815/g.23773  ORF Transcript_19815/g.23773 Transcript_19815/m.23773 type:complete len:364 (+) Transcript_19815:237-1328(+)|eukprot:CAMPEP_0197849344 /NCGR_PEP_ID=MMETSP1438-20131217/11690_1 /TAXON_ID=1461541 /ORGANISM="Pterosperma sp., Strain CCMP1384" /LENGTH=363 /DNA_ID=CAMNT_0043461977 /DNA_START=227 /DNA_END=1318 /DNA_ORIENTATION=+